MTDQNTRHVTIYRESGRYAGWPANYGIWSWGDEIIVGFTVGYHSDEGGFHSRDRSRPFVAMQARSMDGGETWDVNPTPAPSPGGRGLSADEHMNPALAVGELLDGPDGLQDCPGGIDFTHPDLALMCARSGLRAGAVSWFYYSYDRCKTWQGPYRLPDFGQTGIAARTDYLISDSDTCTLFLTAAKPDNGEGWTFCARTSDGGKNFEFVSWIGPDPEGFTIMPATVRLEDGRILAAIRCRNNKANTPSERNWIDLYASDDEGRSWNYVCRPVDSTGVGGNPPSMLRLDDGRLCLIYGYRDEPAGMRAVLSSDDGATWSQPIIIRDDGGSHDVGYPRTVQRPDGTVVAVYYYNDHPEGERYIAASLWTPPT